MNRIKKRQNKKYLNVTRYKLHVTRSGFSLIEILIAMGIFTGVIFVVASFRTNIASLENVLTQRLQSRQDIEQSLQIMSTEIRSAGPSSLGAYAIQSAATSGFTFFSDIDKDSIFERVRYFLGTSTMRKGVIKPTGNPLVYVTSSEVLTTVVQNIISATTTPIFLYFDANYTGAEAPLSQPVNVSNIHTVQFSIYADIKASSSPKPEFFTNTITIRNLRDN